MNTTPPIAVLGLCERAADCPIFNPPTPRWNVLGLSPVVGSFVFPLSLRGYRLVIATQLLGELGASQIVMRNSNGTEVGLITFHLQGRESADSINASGVRESNHPIVAGAWVLWFLPDALSTIVIFEPGHYGFYLRRDAQELPIGVISFAQALAAPLTPDRINAIKSDPLAAKWLRMNLDCNACGDKLRAYTGIERSVECSNDRYVWSLELPDRFRCKCGKVDCDLSSLRSNFHGMLGHRVPQSGENFAPLYEQGALSQIVRDFNALLDLNPSEQTLQEFIQNNPLLLHEFAPERIFHKAKILTRYATDFAVLNSRHELILIEIESADTRLLTGTGDSAQPLNHALDQVRNWLQTVDEHRAATLTCMGLRADEVGQVRGVVIAGRNSSYDPQQLRSLKARDFGRLKFFTFDDVSDSLAEVARRLDSAGGEASGVAQ